MRSVMSWGICIRRSDRLSGMARPMLDYSVRITEQGATMLSSPSGRIKITTRSASRRVSMLPVRSRRQAGRHLRNEKIQTEQGFLAVQAHHAASLLDRLKIVKKVDQPLKDNRKNHAVNGAFNDAGIQNDFRHERNHKAQYCGMDVHGFSFYLKSFLTVFAARKIIIQQWNAVFQLDGCSAVGTYFRQHCGLYMRISRLACAMPVAG